MAAVIGIAEWLILAAVGVGLFGTAALALALRVVRGRVDGREQGRGSGRAKERSADEKASH
jgi:Sec-independent protein translocase protein TatA